MQLRIIILLILAPIFSFSQKLKVSTGIYVSNLKVNDNKILENSLTSVPVFLGIDYLDKEKIGLSSELGYVSIGSKGDFILNNEPISQKEKFDIIQFNTTFRYKFNTNNNYIFYVGLGPKIDYITNTSFNSVIFKDSLKFPSFFIGYKSEAGAIYNFNSFYSGVNLTYMSNLKNRKDNIDYNYSIYGITMSLGYNF